MEIDYGISRGRELDRGGSFDSDDPYRKPSTGPEQTERVGDPRLQRLRSRGDSGDEIGIHSLGDYLSANENLIRVNGPAPLGYEQAKDIVVAFNQADQRWRGSRFSIAFLLNSYHFDPDVLTTWHQLETSIESFAACAHGVYERNVHHGAEVCGTEWNGVEAAYSRLSASLRKERAARYANAINSR